MQKAWGTMCRMQSHDIVYLGKGGGVDIDFLSGWYLQTFVKYVDKYSYHLDKNIFV